MEDAVSHGAPPAQAGRVAVGPDLGSPGPTRVRGALLPADPVGSLTGEQRLRRSDLPAQARPQRTPPCPGLPMAARGRVKTLPPGRVGLCCLHGAASVLPRSPAAWKPNCKWCQVVCRRRVQLQCKDMHVVSRPQALSGEGLWGPSRHSPLSCSGTISCTHS